MKKPPIFKEPPTKQEVLAFFQDQKVNSQEASDFYLFYELQQWRNKGGHLISNWRNHAQRWIREAILFEQDGNIMHQPVLMS